MVMSAVPEGTVNVHGHRPAAVTARAQRRAGP